MPNSLHIVRDVMCEMYWYRNHPPPCKRTPKLATRISPEEGPKAIKGVGIAMTGDLLFPSSLLFSDDTASTGNPETTNLTTAEDGDGEKIRAFVGLGIGLFLLVITIAAVISAAR